ncbi:MAG TPA: cell envelope integrity protein CreD [Rhizomicrobium sp.]|nr:cell envelope integrity protein CreD [Rhizomicrobium sp.]
MTDTAVPPAKGNARYSSPGFKFLAVVLLTLCMVIPLFFIGLALDGREEMASDAASDIASGWGANQTVSGPVLFIPYEYKTESLVDGKAVVTTNRDEAVILPSALNIDTDANVETRWRGIFEVPVYRSSIGLKASFTRAAFDGVFPQGATIFWNAAYASVVVTDPRGLAANVTLQVNDHSATFEPGIGSQNKLANGIHAPLGLSGPPQALNLHATIGLRGSKELSFAPMGEQTVARLHSTWPDPSFFGNFLPNEHAINDKGFSASWSVPYLARGTSQSFASAPDAISTLTASAFGVRFYQPVGFYQLVERSLKYAILFVGLALLVFFVTELVSVKRLHVMQYALIGAAQVLFYLLLLSFAEHIGFGLSYLAAAAGTIAMTCAYAWSAFASAARAAVLAVLLGTLYALLYVILQQEDYALLIGALLLFFALGATMYATRKIDWYRVAPIGPQPS